MKMIWPHLGDCGPDAPKKLGNTGNSGNTPESIGDSCVSAAGGSPETSETRYSARLARVSDVSAPETGPETQKGGENSLVSTVSDVSAKIDATGSKRLETRVRVERELAEHPEQRVVFDAIDAPLRPEPGAPVSIMLAVRTPIGIVSGELSVPRERFDAALFFKSLEESSKTPAPVTAP